MTEVDYQVIDKDGKIHNYIWNDEQRKMVEGKREKNVPWWQIHQIADGLEDNASFKTIIHSNGKRVKQIVIEFTDEED